MLVRCHNEPYVTYDAFRFVLVFLCMTWLLISMQNTSQIMIYSITPKVVS